MNKAQDWFSHGSGHYPWEEGLGKILVGEPDHHSCRLSLREGAVEPER